MIERQKYIKTGKQKGKKVERKYDKKAGRKNGRKIERQEIRKAGRQEGWKIKNENNLVTWGPQTGRVKTARHTIKKTGSRNNIKT